MKVGHSERARTPRFRHAFREEVRSLVRLRHPGIIRVFDYGTISKQAEELSHQRLIAGSPYLVMELAEATLLMYCGRIPWSSIYPILMAVLDALAHAHARGVLHRDIKPDNVLLCGEGTAEVRLADFGIAAPIFQERLEPGARGLLGTPAYMAPEQFSQQWRDYGPWTDLYALGCTAYAMIAGQAPYGHTKVLEEMKQSHLEAPIPALPPGAPVIEGLEEWLALLMAKAPNERFQRAADAAWALQLLEERRRLREGGASSDAPPNAGWQEIDLGIQEEISAVPFDPDAHVESLDGEDSIITSVQQATTWVDSFGFAGLARQRTKQSRPEGEVSPEESFASRVSSASHEGWVGVEKKPPFPSVWAGVSHPGASLPMAEVGLGLFGLRRVPFVGREDERDLLWRALREVTESGSAQALLLEGPAGSGKSRLASWCCERAHEMGVAHSFKATHSPAKGSGAGIAPMLRRFFRCTGLSRHATEARLKRILPAFLPGSQAIQEDAIALAALIAADASRSQEGFTPIQFETTLERYTVIRRCLSHACQERPVVIWLDDVQWGLDSLGFVEHILEIQEEAPLPILFLLTAQKESLASREAESAALVGLRQSPLMKLVPLGRLSNEEQTHFLQGLLPLAPTLAQRVERHCQGNPMFAVQLMKDWIERGLLRYGEGGFQLTQEQTPLPKDLLSIWAERIERAIERYATEASADPAQLREALEMAAVLGHHVLYTEWESVCTLSGFDAPLMLVERMLDWELAFCEIGGPGIGWSFVHHMLRESLERAAQEEGRLGSHHLQCARMLQARPRGVPGERLGRHLLLGGQPLEALAPMLEGIWERVDAGDYRLAQHLLNDWETLLSISSIPASHHYRGEALLLRCRYARGLGLFREARDWAQQAIEAARLHGWERILVHALMQLGYYLWFHGKKPEEGWQCVEEAKTRALSAGNHWAVARCHRYMGDFLCYRGDLNPSGAHYRKAFEAFSKMNDLANMGHARYGLATVARQSGDHETAQTQLLAAKEHFAKSGCRRGIADCLNALGDLVRHKGALLDAKRHYRESMELYRLLGGGNVALCELNLGLVLIEERRFDEARPILERAKATFVKGSHAIFAAAASICLLPCAAADADWETWDACAKQATHWIEETGFYDIDTAHVAQLAGTMALQKADVTRARQAYTLALGQWEALQHVDASESLRSALEALDKKYLPAPESTKELV